MMSRESTLRQSTAHNTWDQRLAEMYDLLRRPLEASIVPPVRRDLAEAESEARGR